MLGPQGGQQPGVKEGCLQPLKGCAVHQVPKEVVVEGKPLLQSSASLASITPYWLYPSRLKNSLQRNKPLPGILWNLPPAIDLWSRLPSSVAAQPQITQALTLQEQLCHCLHAPGLSLAPRESLTLKSPSSKKNQPNKKPQTNQSIFHSIFLESGIHNCAKGAYIVFVQHSAIFCTPLRGWLFSWGKLPAEVSPFPPGESLPPVPCSGRWRYPRAGTEPLSPE